MLVHHYAEPLVKACVWDIVVWVPQVDGFDFHRAIGQKFNDVPNPLKQNMLSGGNRGLPSVDVSEKEAKKTHPSPRGGGRTALKKALLRTRFAVIRDYP